MLSLYVLNSLRLVIITITLFSDNLVRKFVSTCPSAYWDVPSKTCSDPFYSAIQEIALMGQSIPDYVKYEKLCWRWEDTESCYQRLLDLCSDSDEALKTIKYHIERHTIFTRPCRGWNLKRHDNATEPTNMLDCFIPEISILQSCVEAFDKQFRHSLNMESHKSACRVAVRTLNCLATIEDNLITRCGKPANPASTALNFRFIRPLLEETHPLLRSSTCSLPASLQRRFIEVSSSSKLTSCVFVIVFIVCLYFSIDCTRTITTPKHAVPNISSETDILNAVNVKTETQSTPTNQCSIIQPCTATHPNDSAHSRSLPHSMKCLTFHKTHETSNSFHSQN